MAVRKELIMLCVLAIFSLCSTTSTGLADHPSYITNLDSLINGFFYDSPSNSPSSSPSPSSSNVISPAKSPAASPASSPSKSPSPSNGFSPLASPAADSSNSLGSSAAYINVDDFIHKSDKGDHTKGLRRAWDKACATKNAVLVVPNGKIYIAKQLTFSGPCVSNITMQIQGTIQASDNMGDYGDDRQHWIMFKSINGLTVNGGGTFNGKGAVWWRNSCKIDKKLPCKHAPTAVTFYGLRNLVVEQITLKNAQQMHTVIEDCVNVKLLRVDISSPGNSPNTDGIHVTSSRNVIIKHSHIATGDDCISIVSGSVNVQASDITCGPGHGISIGSLGKDHEKVRVQGIHVNRATLTGTMNGVRIKSWQGGQGYATDITFQNVAMHNVSNPIIIDQNYCDQKKACTKSSSAVQIRRVTYKNIHGTSKSEEAIKLDCAANSCKGITLFNVDLKKVGTEHKAKAECDNVKPRMVGTVYPHC